jgi:fumarate hydratase class I
MATPEFVYQDPFPLGKDDTEYRLLTRDYVSVTQFDGREILKIEPEGLTLVANEAIRDVSFLLRTKHLEKVAAILKDPEASNNDRFVAMAMLRNADTSSKECCRSVRIPELPLFGRRASKVWTGAKDEEFWPKVFIRRLRRELEVLTNGSVEYVRRSRYWTNLPTQIDLMATDGMDYQFLFVTKGSGSANKTLCIRRPKPCSTRRV